jgi:hypothetical protein
MWTKLSLLVALVVVIAAVGAGWKWDKAAPKPSSDTTSAAAPARG